MNANLFLKKLCECGGNILVCCSTPIYHNYGKKRKSLICLPVSSFKPWHSDSHTKPAGIKRDHSK